LKEMFAFVIVQSTCQNFARSAGGKKCGDKSYCSIFEIFQIKFKEF